MSKNGESTEDKNNKDKKDKKEMTKEQAVKLVHRLVPVMDAEGNPEMDKKSGEPKTKKVGIKADDVMSFADYDDKVVVVTTAGEKLTYIKPTGK